MARRDNSEPRKLVAPSGRTKRPAYVFVVTASAVFLLAWFTAAPPIQGYVGALIIEYSPTTAKEPSESGLAKYVPAGVEVQPVAGAAGQYRLSSTGKERQAVLAGMEDIARAIAAAKPNVAAIQAAMEHAESRLAAAQVGLARAKQAFQDWDAKRRAAEAAAVALAPPRAPPAEPPGLVNPEWTRADEAVRALLAKITELLAVRTRSHPTVIEVEMRLAEAQRRLAETPRLIPAVAPRPSPPAPPSTTTIPSPSAIDPGEGERLRRALTAAEEEAALAGEARQQAQVSLAEANRPQPRIVRPGEIVGVLSEPFSRGLLVGFSVFACVAGLAAASACVVREAGVFTTVEEITSLLHVPVIAAIATEDGPAAPKASPFRRFAAKVAVALGEATAAGIVLLVVCAAVVDPLVIHVGIERPYQAAALTWEWAWPH